MSDILVSQDGVSQISAVDFKATDGDRIVTSVEKNANPDIRKPFTVAVGNPVGSPIPGVNELRSKIKDGIDFYLRGKDPQVKTAAEESVLK